MTTRFGRLLPGHHQDYRINIFLEESVDAGFQIQVMTHHFTRYNLQSLIYQRPYLEFVFDTNRCNRELTVAYMEIGSQYPLVLPTVH